MFGFVVLPITFLGGTYYQWTRLAPVKVGGWHWLQTVVLINPLIYVNEGMRAAFTDASHMHLYVIYPVLVGFCALFLGLGLRNFRRRVPLVGWPGPGPPARAVSSRTPGTGGRIALTTTPHRRQPQRAWWTLIGTSPTANNPGWFVSNGNGCRSSASHRSSRCSAER